MILSENTTIVLKKVEKICYVEKIQSTLNISHNVERLWIRRVL